jgi:hypothetical protein
MYFMYTRLVLRMFAGLHDRDNQNAPLPIPAIYLLWLPSLTSAFIVDILLLPLFVIIDLFDDGPAAPTKPVEPKKSEPASSNASVLGCPRCGHTEKPHSVWYKCQRCGTIRTLTEADFKRKQGDA